MTANTRLPLSKVQTAEIQRLERSDSLDQMVRILLLLGHPRADSFCAELAKEYGKTARENGAEVREISVGQMDFSPELIEQTPRAQPLEPDLERARELFDWADHIVVIHPVWWGMMPARLKGFFDRLLLPGWAFAEKRPGKEWTPLLRGKTAELILTMDTPVSVHRWVLRAPVERAMKLATLGFCGIKTIRVTRFSGVTHSSAEERAGWLNAVREAARELPHALAKAARRRKCGAWLRIMRLQFYAMTLLAYLLGSFGAAALAGSALRPWPLVLGFLCLFLIELTSVLVNELRDFGTDKLNANAGPFNGGSRVLVDGDLTPAEVGRGLGVVRALFGMAAIALVLALPPDHSRFTIVAALVLGIVLGIGYTAPPLKLAYRGWGELDVAFTHSFFMIACGWVLQGGEVWHPIPWGLGVPLSFAVFAAITLSHIPDCPADRAVGKGTWAVLAGNRAAAAVAMGSVALASVSALALMNWNALLLWPTVFSIPHAILLMQKIRAFRSEGAPSRRIDALLISALAFILWFSAGPLLVLIFRW